MYSTNTLINHYSLSQIQARERVGWQINLRLINNLLLAAIAVSFVAFLINNNDLAVKSFVLKDLKNNLSELTWQNKDLETKITALGSYQYLSQKTSSLQFVPANDVRYLPAGNQSLAKR